MRPASGYDDMIYCAVWKEGKKESKWGFVGESCSRIYI